MQVRRSLRSLFVPIFALRALLLAFAMWFPQGTALAQEAAAVPIPALSGPLAQSLQPLLADPLFQNTESAIQVVSVRTGEEVFSYKADKALQPASTMKILTTAAALKTLGPAYTFKTEILYDGTLGDNGVLDGNLYVKGHGDPTFVVEGLWKLIFDIRAEGVREVKGKVVLDDSFVAKSLWIPGWNKDVDIENGPAYFPPLGALSLNYNTVALLVGPGASVGSQARVESETSSGVIEIQNHVTTGSKGGRTSVRVERKIEDGKVEFTVSGSVPAGSGVRRYYRTVGDPTAYFQGALAAMMQSMEIPVKGKYVVGKVADDARLLFSRSSPPLATILTDVNKHSNNFIAEQVLLAMGAAVHGAPGTTEKGLQVIASYLASLGLSSTDYQIVNGSGLARGTSIRPDLLTAVLVDMYNDQQVGPEFRASLSVGGVDGTLRSRFQRADELGRLRGKTGSLNGVNCLAGYIVGADGEVYAFAFLVNDLSGPLSAAKKVHNRFAETLFGVTQSVSSVADEESGEPAP